MSEYGELLRVGLALLILLGGFLLMRVFSRVLIKFRRMFFKERSIKRDRPFATLFENVFFILVIVFALFFLGFSSVEAFTYQLVGVVPELILFVMLVLLGILLVRLVVAVIERVIAYTGLEELLQDDTSKQLLKLGILGLKIVLYVVLFEFVVSILDIPQLNRVTSFIIYPVLLLIVILVFVAVMNPIRDFAAGLYLKNIWACKQGNHIRFDGRTYTIKTLSWVATELETEEGNRLIVPHRVLGAKGLEFEKPPNEIQTLEELKNRFVSQLPSMCGPASAQIILSIFNIESDQKELSKKAKTIVRTNPEQVAGTHPDTLIKAVEGFTYKKVRGAWIGYDKIYHLKNEINLWLNQGGLLIIDYKKRYLFPTAKRAHYSVVVGVRGDELLVVDPSSEKGGVYFVDYRDVEVGMDTYSELIQGKRGYIVFAPVGTRAYERIKDKLIYSHRSQYHNLSRTLERKLNKFTNTLALLDLLPGFVRKHLKALEKEQVTRVWRPEKKKKKK